MVWANLSYFLEFSTKNLYHHRFEAPGFEKISVTTLKTLWKILYFYLDLFTRRNLSHFSPFSLTFFSFSCAWAHSLSRGMFCPPPRYVSAIKSLKVNLISIEWQCNFLSMFRVIFITGLWKEISLFQAFWYIYNKLWNYFQGGQRISWLMPYLAPIEQRTCHKLFQRMNIPKFYICISPIPPDVTCTGCWARVRDCCTGSSQCSRRCWRRWIRTSPSSCWARSAPASVSSQPHPHPPPLPHLVRPDHRRGTEAGTRMRSSSTRPQTRLPGEVSNRSRPPSRDASALRSRWGSPCSRSSGSSPRTMPSSPFRCGLTSLLRLLMHPPSRSNPLETNKSTGKFLWWD